VKAGGMTAQHNRQTLAIA